MLHFSRWRTAAILILTLAICAFTVTSFLPDTTFKQLPKWAQRAIVLGLDLQGGSHILLEVDSNAVRKEQAEQLRDNVRQALRELCA